jgi:hypothetical protein
MAEMFCFLERKTSARVGWKPSAIQLSKAIFISVGPFPLIDLDFMAIIMYLFFEIGCFTLNKLPRYSSYLRGYMELERKNRGQLPKVLWKIIKMCYVSNIVFVIKAIIRKWGNLINSNTYSLNRSIDNLEFSGSSV